MTQQDTMTVTTSTPKHRQQVRNFALIWTGITLMLGACTFISIYTATGIVAGTGNRNIAPAAVSMADNATDEADAAATADVTSVATSVAAVSAATATTVPPTAVAQAALAQATEEPTVAKSVPATAVPTTVPTSAPPTPTISAVQDTDFDLGIAVQKNADPNVYKIYVDWVKGLKLNWVKTQVTWRDVEQTKGQIDFTELDTSIKMMNAANVKVLLGVTTAPAWARDPGAPTDQPGHLDGPPKNPQDLADFLTTVLTRYKGQIHAVEVWNEINLDREWSTQPQKLDPSRYVNMLKIARDAIKAVDPGILVVSAALSPTGANNGVNYIDDAVYLDSLIKAGMLDYADCVGAHHNGYNVPPDADYNRVPDRGKPVHFDGPWKNPHRSWSFKSTLEAYAKKITAAGKTTKLCVTEFGWPTTEGLDGKPRQGFEFALDNSNIDQAEFTDKAIDEMQNWGFVRLAFLWNLNYGPQAGWSLEGPAGDNVLYSIINKDWNPRPVWAKIEARNFAAKARKASQ